MEIPADSVFFSVATGEGHGSPNCNNNSNQKSAKNTRTLLYGSSVSVLGTMEKVDLDIKVKRGQGHLRHCILKMLQRVTPI